MSWTGAVYRWDMFWADLEPGVGSEQEGGRRPVVVVSNDGFNAAFPVVTVVPATKAAGKRRMPYPFEVLLPAGAITTKHESIVMPHQVRTISKLRLIERIGLLEGDSFREQLENRLLEHFGIAFEQESPGDVREA